MPTPEPPARRRLAAESLLILSIALTSNLAGNGRIGLFDRDEPRYAGCTREMIARSDWLFPTFNGEPRYQKPILIYWLMRAGFVIGGDNPFGARLCSAAAGTSVCLLVLLAGRRWLGPRIAFLGALMLATSPIMVAESKLATTDATLALWVVSAQFCLRGLHDRPSRRLALSFWSLLALAVLTKGPVGPALIAASGVAGWWLGAPTAGWRRLEWRHGVPLFLAVALPWYVAIGVLSQGDFYRFALGRELAHRVATAMESHRGFPGYYLVTSLVTFHPWSALLPAAVTAAWGGRRLDPNVAWLLGWLIGPLVLLECVTTKLVHYSIPALPAAALLAAWLVRGLMDDGVNLRRVPLGRACLGLLGGVGIALATLQVSLAIVLPSPLRWPCLLVGLLLGSGTLAGMSALRNAQAERAVQRLAATWWMALVLVGGWLLPSAEPYRITRPVGEALARLAAAEKAEPMLLSFQEPTVIHAIGRPATLVRGWDSFHRALDRHGKVASAVLEHELKELSSRQELDVVARGRVAGFDLHRGARRELTLVIIRRRPDPSALAYGRRRASSSS